MDTFSLEVAGATIDYCWTRHKVQLYFDAEKHDVCNLLTAEDVVKNFDKEELLESIGVDLAKEYFGLTEDDT